VKHQRSDIRGAIATWMSDLSGMAGNQKPPSSAISSDFCASHAFCSAGGAGTSGQGVARGGRAVDTGFVAAHAETAG
jgi:hypothetical protein